MTAQNRCGLLPDMSFSAKRMKRLLLLLAALCMAMPVLRAADAVPVYNTEEEISEDPAILKQAGALFSSGQALSVADVREQLRRTHCQLKLPAAKSHVLGGREVWAAARSGFLRIGYYYFCADCKKWHLDLSGGFLLTEDGVAATACHVIEPDQDLPKGCLVAVTDDGTVCPVKEVLAASKDSDVCILRVELPAKGLPLALSEDAQPGDQVYCFSDPMGERSFFSTGIVNRRTTMKSGKASPLLLDVSAEWAPGSSGAAVLDNKGNAVGVVSTILALQDDEEERAKKEKPSGATWMVVHEAVSVHEIRALIQAAD